MRNVLMYQLLWNNPPLKSLAKFPLTCGLSERREETLAQRKPPPIANFSQSPEIVIFSEEITILLNSSASYTNRKQLARTPFPSSLNRWTLIFVNYNNRTFWVFRYHYGDQRFRFPGPISFKILRELYSWLLL